MKESSQQQLVGHLKSLIKRQNAWHPSTNDSASYQKLAKELSRETGMSVSTDELAQFWTLPPEKALADTRILGILIKYQGYKDWEDFVDTHQMVLGADSDSTQGSKATDIQDVILHIEHKSKFPFRSILWGVLGLNLLVVIIWLIWLFTH